MNALLRARLPALALLLTVLLATGCASNDIVRGRLQYDLRPEGQRTDLVWPQPPDRPRYRYAGELIGEPNFEVLDKTRGTLETALKWVVGLFENQQPLLLRRPQHGVVSDSGRVYVADPGRKALLVFDPNPPAGEKKGKGEGQLLVWDILDARTRIEAPVAVALAWNGHIAVSDVTLGAVLRLDDTGQLVGAIGSGNLKRPTGLAFDPEQGLLFVADTVAHDIKAYDIEGRLVNTIGSPGDKPGQLNAPTHLAFADGLLYVTDTYNSRVQAFDAEGKHVRSFGERGLYVGNLARPKGVAVSDSGIVYAIESYYGHLLAYNTTGELLMGISGTGMKDDRFILPSGVWTDKRDRVYIADMYNSRIVVFQFLGDKGD